MSDCIDRLHEAMDAAEQALWPAEPGTYRPNRWGGMVLIGYDGYPVRPCSCWKKTDGTPGGGSGGDWHMPGEPCCWSKTKLGQPRAAAEEALK